MTRDGFPHSEILGLKRLLSTIRDLSQTATSFFGFLCQGIHHILLITYLNFFFRTLICCYKTTKPELKKPPWTDTVHVFFRHIHFSRNNVYTSKSFLVISLKMALTFKLYMCCTTLNLCRGLWVFPEQMINIPLKWVNINT